MRKIVKGSDDLLKVALKYQSSYDPFDLTGATEITVCFKAEDGTTVEFTLTGSEVAVDGNALLGKIAVTMSDAKTSLLSSGNPVDFDVIVDKGAERTPIIIEQSLIIQEQNC